MVHDATEDLFRALAKRDPAKAIDVVERVRAGGMAQDRLFDQLFAPAMAVLGGAWADGELDEYSFTRAAAAADQITSFVTAPSAARDTGVTVVAGTMEGDSDAVDKDVTAAALTEAGHRVVDLGTGVRPAAFLERVGETGARIVLVFAQTMAAATAVVRVHEMLVAGGRDDVALLVSGGPFRADGRLAHAVGAAGVVNGAEEALEIVGRAARRGGGAG